MKLIKINNEIRLLSEFNNSFGNVLNIKIASEEKLNALGFYDAFYPPKTEHQRYGNIRNSIFNEVNKLFEVPVIDFTQAEIDAHNEQKLDSDSSASKLSNHKSDGQLALKRIWDRIMRLYDNGQLNDTQFNAISDLLFDALLPLELGLWKVAQARVDALPVGTGILATIRTTVKGIIDDYVIANY